ncbi:ankyrin repeat domain-containing protein [Alistipes putredinis]|uniref:ankyrin repeat domain-containing protein n=1 Tax=Alistipes putredinis TaxID=28117 RepID=UPI0039A2AE84
MIYGPIFFLLKTQLFSLTIIKISSLLLDSVFKDFIVFSTFIKYALTQYKDINDRVYSDEYGLTLLTYACKLSNVKLAHILLEHGINVNGYQSPCDTYKVYPIMEAIANNNIELVKLLLEYHADLDIKDSNGSTTLDLAKETGAKEIENLLLQWMKQQKNNANNAG